MITIIDGWWGSGKSTLRGLLDGHPELFVSPIQDGIFGGFANTKKLQTILDCKDISEFRKVLCGAAEYNRIEKDAWTKSVFNSASGAAWDYGQFNFDFYSFDRAYVSKVMALDFWEPEALVELLYATMVDFWEEYEGERQNLRGYVSMDNNLGPTPEFIIANTSKVKYIWVDRSSADIAAVLMKRKPIEGNFGTLGWGKLTVPRLIRSGHIERHERRRQQILGLQASHPNRVLVVGLADLVENNHQTMIGVANFIGIKDLPILNKYTYGGKEFPGSTKYVGKLNDRAETILDEEQLRMIQSEVRLINRGNWSWRRDYRRLRRAWGAMRQSWGRDRL